MAILSHYFVANADAHVVEAVANDWHDELASFPAWAIRAACKWWLSAENPYRHRKPLPGDISERAKTEMAVVRLLRARVDRFDTFGPTAQPRPKAEISDKARAIMAERFAALAGETADAAKSMRADLSAVEPEKGS